MTHQLTSQPDSVRCLPDDGQLTHHLTEEQFGELLTASGRSTNPSLTLAQAHLFLCERCASEYAGLRDSLSLFRQASTAYADDQLRRLPQMSVPARPMLPVTLEPGYFVAAAAVLLAALLPMQTWRRHLVPQQPAATSGTENHPTESDDALLEDVNRDISASVPAPMQALADPTGSTDIQTSVRNPVQRNEQP